MPKFLMQVTRTVIEKCLIEVEAKDEEDAKDVAIEEVEEDDDTEWDLEDGSETFAEVVKPGETYKD